MVLSKKSMPDDAKIRFSPEDLYRAVTIAAALILVPFSLGEMLTAEAAITDIIQLLSRKTVLINIILSGAAYYIYNEVNFVCIITLYFNFSFQVQFWILDFVEPVTHAVANTAKRCLLIYASVIFFHTTMTPLGIIGSSIAVLGTYIYAILSARQKG